MSNIELKLKDSGQGAFVIDEGDVRLAEMEMAINNGNLTIYHTEVADELKGKGVANQLLSTMAAYARENKLKVIPLCPYVLAQFKRHEDQYADIWNKSWHN
jgi:uncharacterized protein